MMSKYLGGRRTRPAGARRSAKSAGFQHKRLGFENLEQRRLLTLTAPTSVVFQPQTGQGTATLTPANNSSSSEELTFLVSGVTAGNEVDVFADTATTTSNTPIASGTVGASATTITLTSNGSNTLTDNSYTFSAVQIDTTLEEESAPSAASAFDNGQSTQIFAGLTLTQTAVTATAGTPFSYTAAANAPTGDTATIAAGSTLLPGMSFTSSTNTFSGWTPTTGEAGSTQSFTVALSDTLGNSTTVTVYVAVAAATGVAISAPPASIAVGSPVLVSFNTVDSGTPTFTVTTSSSSDPNGADLTATLMPETNQVLQIVTSDGTMDFQLLNNLTPLTVTHFVNLVDSGTYSSNADFYRIIQTFVDQGGVGGTGSTIPVELNPLLRFTSSGLLAMANDGVDGNSSEFFVTNPDDTSDGFLDFRYTIFGKLISGDNVRQAIAETQVGTNASGEDSAPFQDPTITSMSIVTVTDFGVVMLQAQSGATGPYTVTVNDGLGGSQTFTINIGTNQYDPPNPWVKPISVGTNSSGTNPGDQIYTAANTAAMFTPQGDSANNSTVNITASLFLPLVGSNFSQDLVDNTYAGTSPAVVSPNPYMTLNQIGSTYTVTPASGFAGVQVLEVEGQAPTPASWDASASVNPAYTAYVPVFVNPPAPEISSISADGATVTGSTFNNNSSSSTELSFNISDAISGAVVSVYVDGGTTPIATGTAGGTTITVTTTGADKLASGSHTFTVQQVLTTSALTLYADWTGTAGSQSPGVQFPIASNTLDSPISTGTNLTIGLAVLEPPASEVQAGVQYTYIVATNAPSGDTVTITPVTLPAGMVFTAPATFTWTPSSSQVGTSPTFSATLTDAQGNTATIGPVGISVILGLAPSQVPVNVTLGGDATVLFTGDNVLVYDNIGKAVLSDATFKSTDTVEVDLPAGQANSVLVIMPNSANAPLPEEVFVNGASGSTENRVTVLGSNSGNSFVLNGESATDNGMDTQMANVQTLSLAGLGGNNYYTLTNSVAQTWVVAGGGNNTLDFSHDTAGVDVNLGLDGGQLQTIAPWNNNTLSIIGVVNDLIGSEFPNTLIGGPAATTLIRSGASKSTVIGGSGNNVLIGGGGNDTITGGAGQNLIIAGNGLDTIYAAGARSMIFGGTTNFDSSDQALLTLLAEGPLYSYSYTVRRAFAAGALDPEIDSSLLSFHDSGQADTIYGSYLNNWLVLGKYDKVVS
jgi:cyclophilin family peptidyl-prolyl cis-trans isomerase